MSNTSPHIDKYLDVQKLEVLQAHITTQKPEAILNAEIKNKELTLTVLRSNIAEVLRVLKDSPETQFKILIDICGVDLLEKSDSSKRFEVVYHLLSMQKNMRVRLKVQVADGDSVPSVTSVFSSANWFEREVWDMFGIKFENHPDLRRILTDYGFEGHPLRKDFPLNGHVEVYYDEKTKRVAYKPVDMPQATRNFDKISPWQGITGNAKVADEDNVFKAEEFE